MPDSSAGGVLTLVGMLVVVVGILFLAWWVTRMVASYSMGGVAGGRRAVKDGALKLLGQLALGRNERLALVQCGEKCLLLGVTERSVTLLRELTEEEAGQWISRSEVAPPPSFLEALRENLRNNVKKK